MTKKRNQINFWIVIFSAILLIGSGQFDQADAKKNKSKNRKPVAEASASCLKGEWPLSVQFDGSQSVGYDGKIVSYKWRISRAGFKKGEVVNHTFTEPGNYNVTLIVRDDKGARDTDRLSIEVEAKSFHVEKMCIGLVDAEDGTVKAQVGVLMTDASGNPVSDVMVTGRWIGLVKGSAVSSTGADGRAIFLSEATGENGVIMFRVKNAGTYGYAYSASDNKAKKVKVSTESNVNLAPTVYINADCVRGPAPLKVNFCARGCSDADGQIVDYHWEGCDGEIGCGEQVSKVFASPGSHKVTLTVTDDKGAKSSGSVTVEVGALIIPSFGL